MCWRIFLSKYWIAFEHSRNLTFLLLFQFYINLLNQLLLSHLINFVIHTYAINICNTHFDSFSYFPRSKLSLCLDFCYSNSFNLENAFYHFSFWWNVDSLLVNNWRWMWLFCFIVVCLNVYGIDLKYIISGFANYISICTWPVSRSLW